MRKYSLLITLLAVSAVVGVLSSCKKNNLTVDVDPLIVPSRSEFALYDQVPYGKTLNAQSSAPLDRISIPVGITTVANVDRTIQFTYSSTTGAVNGTHYTAPATVTIPAGKALDSLRIIGNFANLLPGVTHLVKVKITGGDVPAFTGKDSLTLTLRRFCPVVTSALLGAYPNTNELWGTSAYGPYNTTVASITPITATTATMVVTNIWDYGWNPITFTMDWTAADPAAWKIDVVPQSSGIADAGTISATYAGQQVAVRAFAGQTGTWDQCSQIITLRFQLGVAGLGYFANLYTVTMKR
jgi:hypothetical protein